MSKILTREQAIALLVELQSELRETVKTLDYLGDKFDGDQKCVTAMQAHINSARSQHQLIKSLAGQLWKKPA